MDLQETQEFNQMVRAWGSMVRRKMTEAAKQFRKGKPGAVQRNKREELKLAESIKAKTNMHYGEVDYVGFSFERHGVFVHKGVGRGYIMVNGMVIRGRKPSDAMKLYAKAKNRAADITKLEGMIRRKPVRWFDPVLDINLPKLADQVAEKKLNATVNATKMYIK